MPDIHIHNHEVEQLLTDLDPNKATGPDSVPAHILKMGAKEIAPALATIFRKSLETGNLREDWRSTNITPIFKRGDCTQPSNYRLVSLTSLCCEVMEHIIHLNVMNHLNKYDILCDHQHGFRQNWSCKSQLILTTNDFAKSLDKGRQTDAIIMDFRKAFDVVAHRRLLLKLSHYGISGPTLTWIDNFLTRRKQRVVIRCDASDWVHVQSGVPRGTVLGPLLFLIYQWLARPNHLHRPPVCWWLCDIQIHQQWLRHRQTPKGPWVCSWEQKWCMKFNTDNLISAFFSRSPLQNKPSNIHTHLMVVLLVKLTHMHILVSIYLTIWNGILIYLKQLQKLTDHWVL